MLLHICLNIMKIEFRTDTIFILTVPKENNSEKKMFLVLCILSALLSNEALYLFKVS